MSSFKLNLTIDQGATFLKTVTWKTGPKNSATPVDLSGCSARMQVRAEIDSEDVLLSLSTTDGRIVLGGPAGTVSLRVESADTAAIDWTAGVYDLEIEFPDVPTPTVRRLLRGAVTVSPEVTR